jgi:heme-degrading monooxygenase HmoA
LDFGYLSPQRLGLLSDVPIPEARLYPRPEWFHCSFGYSASACFRETGIFDQSPLLGTILNKLPDDMRLMLAGGGAFKRVRPLEGMFTRVVEVNT